MYLTISRCSTLEREVARPRPGVPAPASVGRNYRGQLLSSAREPEFQKSPIKHGGNLAKACKLPKIPISEIWLTPTQETRNFLVNYTYLS